MKNNITQYTEELLFKTYGQTEKEVQLPFDIFDITKTLGLEVRQKLLHPDYLGVFIFEENKYGLVVNINPINSKYKQRFIIAYLIGNYIFHKIVFPNKEFDSIVNYKLNFENKNNFKQFSTDFTLELLAPLEYIQKNKEKGVEYLSKFLEVPKKVITHQINKINEMYFISE